MSAQMVIYLMLKELLVLVSGVRASLMITGNITTLCALMPWTGNRIAASMNRIFWGRSYWLTQNEIVPWVPQVSLVKKKIHASNGHFIMCKLNSLLIRDPNQVLHIAAVDVWHIPSVWYIPSLSVYCGVMLYCILFIWEIFYGRKHDRRIWWKLNFFFFLNTSSWV